MSRFLNILAAVLSVSVFGVLVWWGLTLSQLDPNDIPVIKKANGPARVSPEEPTRPQGSWFNGLASTNCHELPRRRAANFGLTNGKAASTLLPAHTAVASRATQHALTHLTHARPITKTCQLFMPFLSN